MVNSSLQALLNLTDTWFLGRISSESVAAVGGVYWMVLSTLLLLGGTGMAVQAFAAQAKGARRSARAAQATWAGFWFAGLLAPLFVGLWYWGPGLIGSIGLPPEVGVLAERYWGPRMLGGPLGVALWALLSFFMGLGDVRKALAVNVVVVCVNALLNHLFIFGLGLGVAGAAWATTLSVGIGVVIALGLFLGPRYRLRYHTHLLWRPRLEAIQAVVRVGLPLGLAIAMDTLGLAAFQAMVTRLGVVPGAATQIVMMLTSLAFMPAVGLGMAGTTLVGQSIGAGDRDWAYRIGLRVVAMTSSYMFLVGLCIAAAGPWLLPVFMTPGDPSAPEVLALAAHLLWIAAAFQFFDGLNIGAGFCLRGAGDTRVPALVLMVLSLGVWVPLTHTLAFAPGEGWVDAPGLGLGAQGGWWAAVFYVILLGSFMLWRWHSRHWQHIRLGR